MKLCIHFVVLPLRTGSVTLSVFLDLDRAKQFMVINGLQGCTEIETIEFELPG